MPQFFIYMKSDKFLTMVNSFYDETKANFKVMLYGIEDRSEGSKIRGNSQSLVATTFRGDMLNW